MKKLLCAFAVVGLLTVGISVPSAFAEDDTDVSAPPPAEEDAASDEDAAEADSEGSDETEE